MLGVCQVPTSKSLRRTCFITHKNGYEPYLTEFINRKSRPEEDISRLVAYSSSNRCQHHTIYTTHRKVLYEPESKPPTGPSLAKRRKNLERSAGVNGGKVEVPVALRGMGLEARTGSSGPWIPFIVGSGPARCDAVSVNARTQQIVRRHESTHTWTTVTQ
jgi:hypothetical protein